IRPRKSGSHQTLRWREMDSNHRSPVAIGQVRTPKCRSPRRKYLHSLDSSRENRRQKEFNNRTLRSGGEEIDDLLNSFIGAVVGGFELAGRLVMRVGAVVEAAVGEWTAEPFVEEQEEQRNLNPLGGETVGVAGAVALQQTVAF